MLITIALFLFFLGVLVVMMSSAQAPKDGEGRRLPGERAKIIALICFIAGVCVLAYYFYLGAFA